MNGLINAGGGKELSSMSTDEIVKFMTDTLREMSVNNTAPLTLFISPCAYNSLAKYRFRKCRVKKGCGSYRYVLIGPPRLTLRVSK